MRWHPRCREVGLARLDILTYPYLGKDVLQQQACAAVELTDAEELAIEVEALERVFDHPGMITSLPLNWRLLRLPGMSVEQSILVPLISTVPEVEARARRVLRWLSQ